MNYREFKIAVSYVVATLVVGLIGVLVAYLSSNESNTRYRTTYDNCIVEKAGPLQGRTLRDYCGVIANRASR